MSDSLVFLFRGLYSFSQLNSTFVSQIYRPISMTAARCKRGPPNRCKPWPSRWFDVCGTRNRDVHGIVKMPYNLYLKIILRMLLQLCVCDI